MLKIFFLPKFIKQFNTLENFLQDEVLEKIELFKDIKSHKQLKVHKLHGNLKEQWSFSVNYKFCIVFRYISKKEVVLLAVGDHEIYK